MRKETIVVVVYKFSELSAEAQEAAKQKYIATNGFTAKDEYMASITKLAEHFDGTLFSYEVDFLNVFPSRASFSMSNIITEKWLKDKLDELGEYNPDTLKGHGECKLTGFCADEAAIDGFRKAYFQGERSLNRLMQAAFSTWLKAAHEDCEAEFKNENFTDFADANDFEYLKNGTLYHKNGSNNV
jgi:hypothetical protein